MKILNTFSSSVLLITVFFCACSQQDERLQLENVQTYIHESHDFTHYKTFSFVMPAAQPNLTIQLDPRKYQRVRSFLIAAFRDKGYRFQTTAEGSDYLLSMVPVLKGKVQLSDGKIHRYNDASLMIQVHTHQGELLW